MCPTLEQLGIAHLTAEEKIELIGLIWDSIAPEVERMMLTETQKRELDRRLAAHEANPTAAIPWEQVREESLARLRRSAPSKDNET